MLERKTAAYIQVYVYPSTRMHLSCHFPFPPLFFLILHSSFPRIRSKERITAALIDFVMQRLSASDRNRSLRNGTREIRCSIHLCAFHEQRRTYSCPSINSNAKSYRDESRELEKRGDPFEGSCL